MCSAHEPPADSGPSAGPRRDSSPGGVGAGRGTLGRYAIRHAVPSAILGLALAVTATALFALAALVSTAETSPRPRTTASMPRPLDAEARLEHLRLTADVRAQREHGWRILSALAEDDPPPGSAFASWHGEDAVFSNGEPLVPARDGARGFLQVVPRPAAGSDDAAERSADTSPLVYTIYNGAARAHVRMHRLFDPNELDRLRTARAHEGDPYGRPSVPPFPRGAVVVKTAWWPVARDRPTPLPVWDHELNPPQAAGNGLVGWTRVVAIEPRANASARGGDIDFAGERRAVSARVRLADFHSVVVDAALAAQLRADPGFRKLAVVTLGRAISAGDHLVLVGAHMATREIDDWIWVTAWWHDAAATGAYAAGRPRALSAPWNNYLLDVAFDATAPAAADGGPHASFNPWFEARFPDGGHGGGTASNCMACHRRASFPAVPFLPVTRGEPDVRGDPAFAPERLATNSLWSIARRARR